MEHNFVAHRPIFRPRIQYLGLLDQLAIHSSMFKHFEKMRAMSGNDRWGKPVTVTAILFKRTVFSSNKGLRRGVIKHYNHYGTDGYRKVIQSNPGKMSFKKHRVCDRFWKTASHDTFNFDSFSNNNHQ